MKKRTLAILLGSLMAATVVFSGCGSKEADTDAADTTEETEEAEVTSPYETDQEAFDMILRHLEPGQVYAYADIDEKHDALLVASGSFDNGDGNMAAIDATIYGFDKNGELMEYGKVESSSTAYPLAVADGCLFYGGNHDMSKVYIDEENGSLITKEYASETFDEDGNASYSYMSVADGKESTPEDDSKLQAMYEEYSTAIVVNFQAQEEQGNVVKPQESEVPESLTEGIYHISIDTSDITSLSETNAGLELNCEVYTEDTYDIVDVHNLAVGDSIVVCGNYYTIETIETNDRGVVVINGGIENNGTELTPFDEDNCYRYVGMDDIGSYTDWGKRMVDVSDNVVLTDNSDPQKTVEVKGKDVVDYVMSSSIGWNQYNTTIRVDNIGQVVEITRSYRP